MTVTTLRFLQANCRLQSSSDDVGGPHDWTKRRPHFFDMLDYARPSVISVQECDENPGQCRDQILGHLGPDWRGVSDHKVGVLYNAAKWCFLDAHQFDMPNGLGNLARRLELVHVASVATGQEFLFGASHFGVNMPDEETIRMTQAQLVVDHIGEVDNGRHLPVAIGIDTNDDQGSILVGVRKVFRAAGMVDMWSQVAADQIGNVDGDTFHGYRPSRRRNLRPDGVFTRGATIISGEVVCTDPDSQFPCATDHNVLLNRIQCGAGVTPSRHR